MSVRSKPSGTTQLQAPEDEVFELADLRQLVETLRRSVRARDDFIAIAVHELRNPMTPIVGRGGARAHQRPKSRRQMPAARHSLAGAPAGSRPGLYSTGNQAA